MWPKAALLRLHCQSLCCLLHLSTCHCCIPQQLDGWQPHEAIATNLHWEDDGLPASLSALSRRFWVLGGNHAGEMELPAKIHSHFPVLVRGECFSRPGASSPAFISAHLLHLGQLFRDLVMTSPPVATLWKCGLAAWQDVLEACVGGVAEQAAFLILKPRFRRLGRVSQVDLIRKLSLACGIFIKSDQLTFRSTTPFQVVQPPCWPYGLDLVALPGPCQQALGAWSTTTWAFHFRPVTLLAFAFLTD